MHVLAQAGLVALGSALGGLTRWGVGSAFARCFGTAFPWGTFFINLSGCLFLGWFATRLSETWLPEGMTWLRARDLQLLVAVGFTGAYTTFSSFELEADGLLRNGENLNGLLYLLGSVVLGLIAVRLGTMLARA